MANRARKLSGINPLAYLGVEPSTPPQLIFEERAPTTDDRAGNLIGAVWILGATDALPARIWMLVRLQAGNATWLELQTGAGGETFVTDNGNVVPVANIVNLTGGTSVGGTATNINTFADPAGSNNLRIALNNSISQPDTNLAGTTGLYSLGGNDFMHNYGVVGNTFLGNSTGNRAGITTGSNNTGIGALVMQNIQNANASTAIGQNSQNANVSATNSTSIGASSLASNIAGDNNTALGYHAMELAVTAGDARNTAVGGFSLQNVTGSQNTAIGYQSGQDLTSGSVNVFVGSGSGSSVTTLSNTVAIGFNAFATATDSGVNTVAVGTEAGETMEDSTSNVLIGYRAGRNINQGGGAAAGIRTVAIGTEVMSVGVLTGNENVAIGYQVAENLTTGNENVFIGSQVVDTATTAASNVIIGHNANKDGNPSSNVVIGYHANATDLTGSTNTIIGFRAMELADNNNTNVVAIGHDSCENLDAGDQVVAVGTGTLRNAGTGHQGTVAVGYNALEACTTQAGVNTAVGYLALSALTTGTDNIALGNAAGSSLATTDSDNILIGNTGTATDNNTIRIGTSGSGAGQQNKCFIAGIRGITTGVADAINVLIDSNGQLGTVSSSARYKENIQDMGFSSAPLMHLRPVTFKYKGDTSGRTQYGLIAEEVHHVMPNLVVYNDKGDPETVRYHELPVMLLNELQKLTHRVAELERKAQKCGCHCRCN